MTDRILDFSEQPARLSVQNGLLKIQLSSQGAGEDAQTVPLAELAAVVVSHPQVSFTQAVLAGIAAGGGILVACDAKWQPAAMMLPLAAHSLQTERFARQAALSLPLRKKMWQQIVRAKLMAHARLLTEKTGHDWGLRLLAPKVRSGDPQNLEAHAARIYWKALFDGSFRRDREAEDLNRHLNYGYAVLRAIVARAICAAGLHPSLGLHHHNRYDAFCLADDLMEPFRPLVDRAVIQIREQRGQEAALDREAKAGIVSALLARFDHEGESRSLFDWVARTASSLAAVAEGRGTNLYIPAL